MEQGITVGKNKISVTQFMLIFWGALLSPMMELLVPVTSRLSPRGAFLAPLLALPFLLLMGYVFRELCGGKQGYYKGISSCYCSFSGKFVLLVYGLWGIVLLALRLQLCASSFRSVGYKEGSFYLLLPLVAGFVFWMAGSHFAGFARSSTLFFAALFVMFVLVLGLSVREVQWERVFPVWVEDIVPVTRSGVAVLGIFGYLIYSTFFLGDVEWSPSPEKNGRFWICWCVAGCVALSLYMVVAFGTFGANLLQDMEQPFLQLAKGVRIQGGFQRIESLTASLWVLSDFILLGVILRGTCYCLEQIQKEWKHQKSSGILMGGIMIISTIIAYIFPYLTRLSDDFVLFGNICLAWLLPLGLFFIKKVLHFPSHGGIIERH